MKFKDTLTQFKVSFISILTVVLDHEYECPFCFSRVQIILNETLYVGDSNQLDYTRISDR